MKQTIRSYKSPWEKEELLWDRFLKDPVVKYMLKNNIPLVRDRYISLAYGNSQAEVPTEDISEMIWDFRPEEYQIPLEEEESPTLRDYVALGILKLEQIEDSV